MQPDRVHAATCAFPWSFGVHISAIPLGDATFLATSELPLFVARYKSSGATGTARMHPVEDEDAPSRSQTEGAVREWLPTFGSRAKISGTTGPASRPDAPAKFC